MQALDKKKKNGKKKTLLSVYFYVCICFVLPIPNFNVKMLRAAV